MNIEGLFLGVLLLLCAGAALTDMRSMRIPNLLCLAGLALFVLMSPLLGWQGVADRLMIAVPAFGVCFLLFAAGLIGGGDAKFFPVMLLFVPPHFVAGFMFCLSVASVAALLLVWIARRMPGSPSSDWQALRERARFPMGVAFLLAVLLVPFLSSPLATA